MKIKKLLGFTIILVIVFSFIGCPEPETETVYITDYITEEVTPSLKSDTIVIDLGGAFGTKNVRVEGTLTASEWNGVSARVKAMLEAAYAESDDPVPFNNVLSRKGITIIVTKENYPNCKAGNFATLYINIGALNNTNLPGKIVEAFGKMNTNDVPYSAQVKKQNRVRFWDGMSAFELV